MDIEKGIKKIEEKLFSKEEIIKDGRMDLSKFKIAESIEGDSAICNMSSFSGMQSVFLFNNKKLNTVDSFYYSDNKIIMICTIFFGKDDEYNSFINHENNTITQLLINEYEKTMERTFENVKFFKEECKHTIDEHALKNIFQFSSSKPSAFKSLSKEDFMKKYKELII